MFASSQLCPPSVETSTFETPLSPLKAMPLSVTVSPAPQLDLPGSVWLPGIEPCGVEARDHLVVLGLPALLAVVAVLDGAIVELYAVYPLHAPFAVVAGHQDASRVAVALGELLSVHLVGDDRRLFHDLLEADVVGVAVCRVNEGVNDTGFRVYILEQVA